MRKILAAASATAILAGALAACGNSAVTDGYGAAGGPSTPGSVQSPGASSAEPAGPIAWSTCTDLERPDGQAPAKPDPSLQCGKLKVPLDYAKPTGEMLDIAVIKVRATGPGERLGSLVFNFGGPGASGVDTMARAAKVFDTLRAHYDLVSFDPRGVERSSGVRCGDNKIMDKFTSMNSLATTPAEQAEMDRTIKEFADACGQTSGRILPYVGTVNTARDMDRLREAVGDRQLNYFGISYGTQLGAVYATQFAKNVGRFVLDSPLDPSVGLDKRTLVQTRGFQHAYEAFLKDCVKGPGPCEIGADTTIANKNVDTFLADLRKKPLQVGARQVTQGLASTGISAALYSALTWPLLEQGLTQGFKGDGRILLTLADSYNGRKPDGSYSTLMSSFPAISCVDTAERPTPQELAAVQAEAEKISPLFASQGMGSICRVWPVPGSDEARKVNATGSGPIVVVGGTGDPATPYEWAPKLTEKLTTGVLVTYKGEGHGAYLSGDACVKKAVDNYLVGGKTPAKGTTCPTS
ncbi:alpha/beta hydrolase [Streptosporangium sp. NBC_01756]|uniref:alpha/beta hydrolase n=1 Tax=Streptosporangium sp. NBC_01756 TaxID=2975950 RepID=UPI002DDB5ADB|nr:alpha/beta hydrolase [Streptosporangium sp. NBC_01756]WSC88013.1 alpha/beta hydrolase [Streptosporangium sp. NBC_01756]